MAIIPVRLVSVFIRTANIADLRTAVLQRQRGQLAADLAEFYRERRSWDGVRQPVDATLSICFLGGLDDPAPSEPAPPIGAPPRTFAFPAVVDADRAVVLPVSDYQMGTKVP